ncbi:MAG: hypothetical protein ACFFCE_14280 [Promethearchaeota archaeon]
MLIELLEEEKLVFDVVKEYLNKNRYFNVNEIIPFIIARFRSTSKNINISGIEEILKSLVNKNILVEGSKLSIDDILKNQKRKLIYDFIIYNPGVYFSRIVRELKLSNHVVVWHLNILLKFNFIKKEKIEHHDIYFDSKYNLKDKKIRYLTSKEKSRKIIDYLRKFDYGITKTQLSKDLKMHISTITKYIEMFIQLHIIFEKRVSKRSLYFLSEDFVEI